MNKSVLLLHSLGRAWFIGAALSLMLRVRHSFICSLLASTLLAPSVHSQNITWPAPRGTHGMAWHSRLQQALLFGGVSATTDNALWGWNGATWGVLATGGPAGRAHFAMTYDSKRDRVVVQGGVAAVFGTNTPTRFGDTWEWDRHSWRRVSSAGPGVRDHHSMVYDPVRKQIMLFGGADSVGTQLNDTWTWDGRVWTKRAADNPPGRSTHRMAYDAKRGVTVLFGGWGDSGRLLNDTWEWDGRAWKLVATATAPSPRFAMRITYDAMRERVVLFGGRGPNGNFSDTWVFDGRTWTRMDVAGPSTRNVHEMVYDSRANATRLFGGFNAPVNFNDLWSFDGAAWKQIPRPDARSVGATYVVYGPHAVGYRVISQWDASRRLTPARDFEGRANVGDGAMPLQVSVWYPARSGGTPMRVGEYHALAAKSQTLTPIVEADVAAAGNAIRNTNFSLGIELPQHTADSIAALRVKSVRDAVPMDGRFPLIVGGLETPSLAYGIAEYLASHGYVVVSVPSNWATAAQQVARVPVAIETHTRNMEVAQGIASALPFVDRSRIGLIGVNFNGLAALTHEMRNMGAAAVVSIDGYETKTFSAAGLRASPYYDPARLRVPYLSFSQDNAPNANLGFSDSLARELKYAQRYAYVVRDMDHPALLENLLVYPQLRAEKRLGYEFIWRTIRSFLDAYVNDDTTAKAFITRSAVANGFPTWLVKTELKIPALPAIPTAEEVEQIAMTGNVERLRSIRRQARAGDSTARVFDMASLGLYSFRFFQRGDRETALAFNQLAVEAFPLSAVALNNLGNAYRDMGQLPRAIELFEQALAMLERDPSMSPSDRAQSRTVIENKIRQLRSQP